MVVCEFCGRSDMLVKVCKKHSIYFRRRIFNRVVNGFRCLNCEKSFISAEQDDLLEKEYQDFVAKVKKETRRYTCSGCNKTEACPYSWNYNNVNGKCLASE